MILLKEGLRKWLLKKFILNKENAKLSPKEEAQLKKAAQMEQTSDPDFPPFTEEQLMHFRRISEIKKEEKASNRKQNVTIRLSPATIKKARLLGKGYTGFVCYLTGWSTPEVTRSGAMRGV